jgi:opacity protein-like surface antigen
MRALFFSLLCFAATVAHAAKPYLRLGTGFDRSRDTTQRDIDCAATAPPALFGCGDGLDGRPFGARGDFGRTMTWDLAGGLELTPRTRAELALTHRNSLDLDARSNFLGVSEDQPVHAHGRASSALLSGSVDAGRFFVTAGAGVARNELGAVTFSFPSIAADAVTITQGGTHTSFAWTAGAGTHIPLAPRLNLDVAIRYTDLGAFRTNEGSATIVRPNRTLILPIAATEAKARALGVSASLRWRL